MIAKRRIGRTSHRVSEFIVNTDLDGLLPEHCELLLKFIPTEEEVRVWVCMDIFIFAIQLSDLSKHAHRVKEFGEAELFMYDVSH